MTKVLQLGHGFDTATNIGETYNSFTDAGYEKLADVWSRLYENEKADIETIEDQETLVLLVIWLANNGFKRSAEHIKKTAKLDVYMFRAVDGW